ncbi:histidine phosphatase family protein [Candidatus Mycobacterium wuenschmannii]|uniref:Histidine phosphatase family protein n=1 Tax=Candidatus Mycobacterium wuenschmannii TaxID=3027808 RepID=A0ABY8VS16_9MYCO|nr:histidine phosphatase family protein [Candidatus Mycobacterium wuenschmannii]WIM86297.1 histidine phosphatase family protein [Candidatus Mycobacterium wuenschmannii]
MRRALTVGLLSAAMLSTAPALASADDGSIVIDFIRHAEGGDNLAINTTVPGPGLTEIGKIEAADLVTTLQANHVDVDEIWASTMIRSQETAAPLAESLNMYPLDPTHLLAGLNEIDAGIFEGAPVGVGDVPLGGALYLLAPALWTLGLTSVPELGSTDANGIVFDARVDQAMEAIYAGTATGDTSAVFSHEGTIAIWALMNVDNPDFGLVLKELFTTGELLPFTGQVVIDGSPGDWSLVSWDGMPVARDPGLLTDLFVDFRDFIQVPQLAGYDIYEALLTGNAATIDAAIQTGVSQVDAALAQFPVAVFDDFVTALGGSI